MTKKSIEAIAEKLWKERSEENWMELEKALKSSTVKYYKVFYENGKLKRAQDLRSSYAELYDAKGRQIAKIPIVIDNGKEVKGALIYLKSLSGLRK